MDRSIHTYVQNDVWKKEKERIKEGNIERRIIVRKEVWAGQREREREGERGGKVRKPEDLK